MVKTDFYILFAARY